MASSKSQDLLVSVAESIGSTLGAIAAKADAAQKAIASGTDTAVKEVKRGANEARAQRQDNGGKSPAVEAGTQGAIICPLSTGDGAQSSA